MRIALLRGINVGGHRKVPMADLRLAMADAGLTDVATHIQSGNVVFSGGPGGERACADLIADTVEAAFDFRVPIVLRTDVELSAALAAHPFDPPDGGEKLLHILFCDSAPSAEAVASLDADRAPGDRWAVLGREIHVRYATGSGSSKATGDWFERKLGVTATSRNLVTVRRLVEMAR